MTGQGFKGGGAPANKLLKGFTMAEVLITLGILGILIAMTLPALVQKYQEKVTINRLKKVYSTLSQLYVFVSEKDGTPAEWGYVYNEDGSLDRSGTIQNIFSKYLRKLQVCKDSYCQNPLYKLLNGTEDGNSSYRIGNSPLILEDGTLLRANMDDRYTFDCSIVRGTTNALKNVCFEIMVDVNARQNPSTYGRDVFVFYWTKYGIVPVGSVEETSGVMPFSTCSRSGSGYGCAAWVLAFENMDYLHCDGLSWNGKKSCK